MDGIGVDEKYCPGCHAELDPHEVWSTRKYAGTIVLPHWFKTYGIPVAVIAVALAIVVCLHYFFYPYLLYRPWLLATGFGMLIVAVIVGKGVWD